ncbi:MAG: O-antigen ligase family protein [Nitrospira sp. BO4]|jgi:O-antigen ligase|nr:O-antigen ligase family protein [Nitrospira sp. BO4]
MLLAVACLLSPGGQKLGIYKPVTWAFCTVIVLIVIQLLFHEWDEKAAVEVTAFVQWFALLITVQALSLRPRFLQRFALVAFAIGLACLPYLNVKAVGGVMRAWAAGTGIANPNVLGMWFGFCTVYFIFWGLQSRELFTRIAIWTAAIFSFFIVLIAVSRGPLFAIVLACIVGFRSALKRSFGPLLTLTFLVFVVSLSGVFDDWFGYYFSRGAEKSGRERLWPAAMERILDSPWVGVGLGDIGMRQSDGEMAPPHNPLLHIALGGGVVPVICFFGYLTRVVMGALRVMQRGHMDEAALLLPLIVFALTEIMILDLVFMTPWMAVVLGMAASQIDAPRRSIAA